MLASLILTRGTLYVEDDEWTKAFFAADGPMRLGMLKGLADAKATRHLYDKDGKAAEGERPRLFLPQSPR